MAKFRKSNTGGKIFVDDENYSYHYHKKNSDETKTYWRCVVRSCKARIHTVNDAVTTHHNEHNHGSSAAEIRAQEAMSQLKTTSVSTYEPSRSLIGETLVNENEYSLSKLPSFSSMGRNIRRWRQKAHNAPPIPRQINNFEIPEFYCFLATGEKFLAFDSGIDDENRILIFATDNGLEDLVRSPNWAADGTFKVSPLIFYQLYCIHMQESTFSIPRVFALLPGKTKEIYIRLFTYLLQLKPQLNPKYLLTDFEIGAQKGFIEKFPEASISSCLFHLSKSIFKKICDLGFRQRYKEDEAFNLKIRCFSALSFLPVSDVVEGFIDLSDDTDLPSEFIAYFEMTYIGHIRGRRRIRMEPIFAIASWNVRERVISHLPRSNNNLEGLHNALQYSLSCQHPSIWKLIETLKKEEAIAVKKKKTTFNEEFLRGKKIKLLIRESLHYWINILQKTR